MTQSAEIHVEVRRHGVGTVLGGDLPGHHPQLMRDSPAATVNFPPPFKPLPGFRQALQLYASHRPSSSKVEVGTDSFFQVTLKDSCRLAASTPSTAPFVMELL
jgi:hypothetical protein